MDYAMGDFTPYAPLNVSVTVRGNIQELCPASSYFGSQVMTKREECVLVGQAAACHELTACSCTASSYLPCLIPWACPLDHSPALSASRAAYRIIQSDLFCTCPDAPYSPLGLLRVSDHGAQSLAVVPGLLRQGRHCILLPREAQGAGRLPCTPHHLHKTTHLMSACLS